MVQQKIVLITGATGAIGTAAARKLAAAGCHVVLGARGVARLAALAASIRAAGGSVEYRAVDVTDPDDAQAFALAAFHRHGRIDVLVNAAILTPQARLDTLKLGEWDRMLDVNVRGALYMIAAVQPLMRIAGSGHVVTLAGETGLPEAGVLGATHAAVRALSDSLRQEEKHLRVTVLCPSCGADGVARAIVCAVRAPDYAAAVRRPLRTVRRLTWAGDGRGTSAAPPGSRSPASTR